MQKMVECAAVTPGSIYVGDGTTSGRFTSSSTSKSSSSTVTCIFLHDVSLINEWEHQKNDFIQGHGDENSGKNMDDVDFVWHLLTIHAKLCTEGDLEAPCRSRCSRNHTSTKNITSRESSELASNFCHAAQNQQGQDEGASEKESCRSTSEGARYVSLTGLAMKPPDALSLALQIKQENDDMREGTCDLDSGPDALPEVYLDGEMYRLQEVAMESPEVSHDQQGCLYAMESPDDSHDKQRKSVVVKTEERISEGGDECLKPSVSVASREIERELLEMKTAKIVLQKLPIGRKHAKCMDCHKILHGSSFQYSLDGTDHNVVKKCDKCKKDGTTETVYHTTTMDTGAGNPSENTSHPTHQGTGKPGHKVMFKSNLSARVEYADVLMNKLDASSGQYPPPQNLEVTGQEAIPEGVTGTCRSRIPSRIHTDELNEDKMEMSDVNIKEVGRQYKNSLFSKIVLDKSNVLMHKDEQPCVKLCASEACSEEVDSLSEELRPFRCKVCSKNFSYKVLMTAHMRTHTGEKPFMCRICSNVFSQKSSLKRHMLIHTGERPFLCSVCSKGFYEKGNLVNHMRIHTGERPFLCSVCSKGFSQKGDLAKHTRTHTGERPFLCGVCSKVFSDRSSLKRHMMTHTGERPFLCSVCSKGFHRKVELTRHMTMHTDDKPEFSCIVCSKGFCQKSHLTTHMRIHTGDRPFSCSVCSKSFSKKGDLTTHMRTHTGERPFRCSVCSKDFCQKIHLTAHMRIHTGDRPYTCRICAKTFSVQFSLKRHIGLHAVQ